MLSGRFRLSTPFVYIFHLSKGISLVNAPFAIDHRLNYFDPPVSKQLRKKREVIAPPNPTKIYLKNNPRN